jgi:hypothetical protein
MIEVRQSKHALWGWKDPRSILFLPQWKRLLPELKVLLLWRPCAPVVRSLLKRARAARHPHLHVSPAQAVAMWRVHNEHVCDFKERFPDDTLLFPLSAVLENDRAACDALNSRLGLGLNYVSIRDLYDPTLLRGEPSSRLARRVAQFRFGGGDLEARLQKLSDLSANQSENGSES